jgi:hypothetical protein
MDQTNMSPPNKLLIIMHNTSAVRPENSRSSVDLSKIVQISAIEILTILEDFEKDGYVKSLLDPQNTKKFYLTGKGILKVCSYFT